VLGDEDGMEKHLIDDLNKLREQVAALDSADEESKQKLNALIYDIEQRIQNGDSGDADNLVSQVEQSIARFETTHPTLTAVLNNIMVSLGNMGV
jgi:seryl-tRNA synthetase